jgi:hypothetical protein
LGLPENWEFVENWLTGKSLPETRGTVDENNHKEKASTGNASSAVDWETFPKKNIPVNPETRINIEELKKIIERNKENLLDHELKRAQRAVAYLEEGAPAHQVRHLKSCLVKNKIPSSEANEAVLETVANWVKEGFVAGPFRQPPLDNFRVNGMIAIIKGQKVRPVLNVSEPGGSSFNDNVDKYQVERVTMDNARTFSYTLLEAGKNARIDKTDVKNAFKNVPAKIDDLNLQGFMLNGRFFIELRMIFGACTALANYDILGNTVEKLAVAESRIPRRYVRRAVDDQPTATPAGSRWGECFVNTYKKICQDINIELAEDCENCDKAFTNKTCGKVLGVWFRSSDLTWKLPEEKVELYLQKIAEVAGSSSVTLDDMQSLMGRLNFLCMMCPFLKSFRYNLNKELSMRLAGNAVNYGLSEIAINDMLVHARVLEAGWLPIAREVTAPPPCASVFTSDAAGLPDNKQMSGGIGCATVGFDHEGSMILAAQQFWPETFIMELSDSTGTRFGNKTTTLECIGMLLPFLYRPDLVANQHVVLRVDNVACVYGFENGQVRSDETASIFIRSAKIIAAYLGTVVHVQHVKRRSCWEAELADNMSRQDTSGFIERRALSRFEARTWPAALLDWFRNPVNDWGLPLSLLKHVKSELK